MRNISRCVLKALLCCLLVIFAGLSAEASTENTDVPAIPDPGEDWTPDSYEIHLMLNSDLVLDENHLLKQEVLEAFHADDDYKIFSLAYFETLERDFFEEGWVNRLRLKYEEDDINNFKLTYKKRYPVPEYDLNAAIALAQKEGFDLSGGIWEPQVDWGYTGMTLSLSAETSVRTDREKTIADLAPGEGLAMMLEDMPAQERNWKAEGWGTETFGSAELAGPIFFNRYKGEFLDVKVTIEVWEIRDERDDAVYYLTELSFKADDQEEATLNREMIMDKLLSLGILLKVDSLKTQQMLDAYLVAPD